MGTVLELETTSTSRLWKCLPFGTVHICSLKGFIPWSQRQVMPYWSKDHSGIVPAQGSLLEKAVLNVRQKVDTNSQIQGPLTGLFQNLQGLILENCGSLQTVWVYSRCCEKSRPPQKIRLCFLLTEDSSAPPHILGNALCKTSISFKYLSARAKLKFYNEQVVGYKQGCV